MKPPNGYRFERELLWPAYDKKCAAVIFNMAKDLDIVMGFVNAQMGAKEIDGKMVVTKPRVAVQAGGNCGVWPRVLSPLFETVYTFEPDPRNFRALAFNTMPHPNVIAIQAALGFDRAKIKIGLADHELDNCGAGFVEAGGTIPTLRVDDLDLSVCDLLYLDIEGFELPALRGADYTIHTCRPVIAIEDKGLSDRYGIAQGDAEKYLAERHEYVVLKRIHKDVILGHVSMT